MQNKPPRRQIALALALALLLSLAIPSGALAAADYEDCFFYNQLDENARGIYRAAMSLNYRSGEQVSVSLNSYVDPDMIHDAMQGRAVLDGYTALDIAYHSAVNALNHDNTLPWYVNLTSIRLSLKGSVASDGTILDYNLALLVYEGASVIRGMSYSGLENADRAVQSQIANIAAAAKASSTRKAEQVRYVHDYLVDSIEYSDSGDLLPYSEYGALVLRSCVCEGYARSTKEILEKLGIPCVLASGDNHMWNCVKLGKYWYALDVTWDDTAETDRFFLAGSNSFMKEHTEEAYLNGYPTEFAFPALSEVSYASRSADSKAFYYNQLSIDEKGIYEALCAIDYASMARAKVDLSSYGVDMDNVTDYYISGAGRLNKSFNNALFAAIMDNEVPSYVAQDKIELATSRNNRGSYLLSPKAYAVFVGGANSLTFSSAANAYSYENSINTIAKNAASAAKSSGEAEKIKSIYNHLLDDIGSSDSFTCAETLKASLDAVGIDCIIIAYEASGSTRYCNYVNCSGKWYMTDLSRRLYMRGSADAPISSSASRTFAYPKLCGSDLEAAPKLPADINGDNLVNAADLSLLLKSYGKTGALASDINGDNLVNAADLSLLLKSYGKSA